MLGFITILVMSIIAAAILMTCGGIIIMLIPVAVKIGAAIVVFGLISSLVNDTNKKNKK